MENRMALMNGQPGANEEAISPMKPVATDNDMESTSTPLFRRVLADVSPNVRAASNTPAFLKKALAGSPLKRSFTAAMEGGEGLSYLKRRRLGDNEVLSEVAEAASRPTSAQISEALAGNSLVECLSPSWQEPSPTEPNTPSDNNDTPPGSSAERRSFSSLINYDPSSQPSGLLFNGLSTAELLQLRLRVAMYKVRTNQIDVPFLNLQDETRSKEEKNRRAIEEAVAELRREAQEVLARAPQSSSSAMLSSPQLPDDDQPTCKSRSPSLPPTSRSPEKLPMAMATLTPIRGSLTTSTPPNSVPRLYRQEQELTSSVIKGRVAEGLLGLRNAA